MKLGQIYYNIRTRLRYETYGVISTCYQNLNKDEVYDSGVLPPAICLSDITAGSMVLFLLREQSLFAIGSASFSSYDEDLGDFAYRKLEP